MMGSILPVLPKDYPWEGQIQSYAQVTSTNQLLKELARSGAPEGTAILANSQTAGRGRLGRSFCSPADSGIYLSLLLRPMCPAEKLMHLTCSVAVAVCDGVEYVTGFRPRVKWINDLVFEGKKMGGILTELIFSPDGQVECAVIGIGLNVAPGEFPKELQKIVCSLEEAVGEPVSRDALAGAILSRLAQMNQALLSSAPLERYRRDCVTLGSRVRVMGSTASRTGTALQLADNGALLVEFEDGTRAWVNSGEVSVRGLWDYV